MKTLTSLFILLLAFNTLAGEPKNITTNVADAGTSDKVELSLFHLNHVLYIKAFVLSDIYPTISAEEMSYINATLINNIREGKRTQFIIKTPQKTPYRLAVFVTTNENQQMLVILTNYNPKSGTFEKEIADDFYATTAELSEGVVIGKMFEMPLQNRAQYLEKKDYLSAINATIFNTIPDTAQLNEWFTLAEQTQADSHNNTNFLKSYYYLTQSNFEESEQFLKALKTSVANSPEGEQNQWGMFIKVLSFEIEALQYKAK